MEKNGGDALNTGDHTLIKNINRQIILEKIIETGSISRAQLSKVTGLNKATITSQIAVLLNDRIVIETTFDKSTGGRKPILLSLNTRAAYAIGIDVDREHIHFLLTDLEGNVITKQCMGMDTTSFESTKKVLKEKIQSLIDSTPCSAYGVVGIGIGIHGMVDKNEKITFATHSKWKNVDLKDYLRTAFNIPVFIDNNTNFCTYAEKTFYVNDSNLVCLTTSTGIGLGIVIDNVLYKGLHGFAGEIGHMIIEADGKQCGCGSKGCWELYASEKAFLENLSAEKNLETCSLREVKQWIGQKDAVTLELLKKLSKYLSIGINNIINIFNPETIIINSQLISMYPEMIRRIESELSSGMNDYKRILYSKLCKDACVLGACAIVIKHFLNISDLKLMKE
ncbi:MAG: ROK family protein [Firmicutes bacterium]|nr:ROK family protein [Bacillota bacterium]